jgi:hypothetical protein
MPENSKTMDSQQQLQALFNLNIKTTAMFEFNQRIDQLCCSCKHSGSGVAMLVSATSGTGATHMARAYCMSSNTGKKIDNEPVNLLVTVPIPPNANNMADRILRKLGAAKIPNSLYSKTLMCKELLRPDRFRSLIIDDGSREYGYDSKDSKYTFYWLITLCRENNVPIVLIVNTKRIRGYFTRHLLFRALTEYHEIKPLKWKGDADHFLSLMRKVDSKLPFDSPSCLITEKSAMALFRATGGRMGMIMMIVNKAGLLAIEHNFPTISIDLLNASIKMMTNPIYDEFLRENGNNKRRRFIRADKFDDLKPIHHLLDKYENLKASNKKVSTIDSRQPSADKQMK